MNNMKKMALVLFLFLMIVTGINSFKLYGSSNHIGVNNHIKSVTAITEVFGDGQKLTAVGIEFDKNILSSKLSRSVFSVEGRTITNIYTNSSIATSAQSVNGKYVIIELSPSDNEAATYIQSGRTSTRKEAKVTVSQIEDVVTTDGEKYSPGPDKINNTKVINLVVDDFKQLEYKDPETGEILRYNLFVPKKYDKNKSYPMLLFMHDAGVTSTVTTTTLIQGIGGVIWATPSEQAKHECFVLAPQYSTQIVNDNSEASEYLDITVDLINSLANQYSIDKNRLYTTGQSGGCMMSIAMDIKYPDLFAASLLVAGQWNATKVFPIVNDKMWIIVSEGDLKAYPGMNAITAELEKDGAKVSRAVWNGQWSTAEFASGVSKMMAEGNNIKYTVLKKGTVVPSGMKDDGGSNHVCTWRIAYGIEGVRDWLFLQKK
jgi:predicted peptidase